MNIEATAAALKSRLAPPAAPAVKSQEPAGPGGIPAPVVPSPAPPPPAPAPVAAAPAAQAPAMVPAQPAAPPPPGPDLSALMVQMKDLQAANDRLSAEVQTLRTAPVHPLNIKLPSKEQLDAMPQSEALALVVSGITEQVTSALQSQRAPLEQQLGMLQHNLNAVRKVEAENALKARFPRLDLEKIRPAFEAKLVANRSLSFEDAVRLVAEPADLLPADPKPTTPAPSVHIETGLPTGSAASAAPATKEPTDAEIIAQATAALRSGDTYGHKKLMAEAVKRRLNFATAPG